jgi:hypothetical protein
MSLIIDLGTRQFKYVSKGCESEHKDGYYLPQPVANPLATFSFNEWKSRFEPELLNIIAYITHSIETYDAVASNGLVLLVDYKALCDKLSRFIYQTSENKSKRFYFLK